MNSQNKVLASNDRKLMIPYQTTSYGLRLVSLKDRKSHARKSGHWSDKQNAKYCAFLDKFKLKFSQKSSRRQWKVFKALAKFIGTRNADQCRSHHHKMKRNFNSIDEIIHFMHAKNTAFQELCTIYFKELKQIQFQIFLDKSCQQQNIKQFICFNQNRPTIQNQHGKGNIEKNIKTGISYEENVLDKPANLPFSQQQQQISPLQFQQTKLYHHNQKIELETIKHISQQQLKLKIIQCHQCFLQWYTKATRLFSSIFEQHPQ